MFSQSAYSNHVVGYSSCGHCANTKKMLSEAPVPSATVQYVDCTPGSDTAGHVACSTPGITGVPAMVQCDAFGTCSVVGMGARQSVQEIESVFDASAAPPDHDSGSIPK
jgi:hypothetical protein